jgi:hypothetical protein
MPTCCEPFSNYKQMKRLKVKPKQVRFLPLYACEMLTVQTQNSLSQNLDRWFEIVEFHSACKH